MVERPEVTPATAATELTLPEHGTTARYHRGCRCDDCRTAAAAYMRDYRRRTDHYDVKVLRRAEKEAARWMRKNQPVAWEQCKREAEDHVQARMAL